MSDAFVRGGSGDIKFDQLPAAHGKAFWPLHEKKLAADLYEQEHPGVTVRRDWETDEQHKARKAERPPSSVAEPELSMSPDRARRELRLKLAEFHGLPLDHPKYDEQFDAHVRNIHLLQDVLGEQHTRFERNVQLKKAAETPVAPEMVEKIAKYKALSPGKRRESIAKAQNIELLLMVRDVEPDAEIQALIVARIGELGMAKKETVVV